MPTSVKVIAIILVVVVLAAGAATLALVFHRVPFQVQRPANDDTLRTHRSRRGLEPGANHRREAPRAVDALVSVPDRMHLSVQIPNPPALQRASEALIQAQRDFQKSVPPQEAFDAALKFSGEDRARAIAALAPGNAPLQEMLTHLRRLAMRSQRTGRKASAIPSRWCPAPSASADTTRCWLSMRLARISIRSCWMARRC